LEDHKVLLRAKEDGALPGMKALRRMGMNPMQRRSLEKVRWDK
jgi:hypothetical protein